MPEGLWKRFARRLAIVLWVAVFAVAVSYLVVWYGGSTPITSGKQLDDFPSEFFPMAVERIDNGRVVESGFVVYYELKTLKMPPDLRLLQPGNKPRTLTKISYGEHQAVPNWHATLRWATNLRGERFVEVHAINPDAEEEFDNQSFYTISGDSVVPAYFREPWYRFFSRVSPLPWPGLILVPYVAWLCIGAVRSRRRRPVKPPSALRVFRIVGLVLAMASWGACAWPILFDAWQLPELLGGGLALAMLGGLLWLQVTSPEWAVTVALAQCLGTVTVFAPVAGPSPPVAFAVLWIVNTLCWFAISIWTLRRWKAAASGPNRQEGASTAYPETLWVLYGLTAFFSPVMWPFFWGAILKHL
jgi:hypothetical protein